jgi:two-component system, sensor histidine kinase
MKKLLYIDDEIHNLTTLEIALRKSFNVFTLDNPIEALDVIAKEDIPLVITDQRMPGMTGLELARKINTQHPDIIIIILTAFDDNETMLEAINQGGIFRYLLKPWDLKDLRQTIKSALETYELRKKNVNLINDLLRQNNELSVQERRYRLLFENTNDAIIIFDDQTFVDCNNKTFELFQTTREAFIGKSISQFSPEYQPDGLNSAEKGEEIIQKTLNGTPQIVEWQHKRYDGSLFSVSMSLTLIENDEQNTTLQAVLRDITLQKKAENDLRESEEKYRMIFESSPLGIAHFGNNGGFTRINKVFSGITGIEPMLVKSFSLSDIGDKKLTQAYVDIVDNKEPVYYDSSFSSIKTLKSTFLRVMVTPIFREENFDGGLVIIEDMTEKIKQEELKKQIAIAKESAKFKQNFLASMSHEIRTPLTGVMGMTDILEQTELTDKQKEYISILKHSGEDLRQIINQVLDFSKIEAGKITLKKEAFPFSSIPDKAQKLFQSICKKELQFEKYLDPEIPEIIIADEIRLMQIVNNLISNAVKFTAEGKIAIHTKLISRDNNNNTLKIKISVADTGKGIPEEQQSLLFNPFIQIDDSQTRKIEGTGLGLSISRELAKLHGGEIGLVSKPDQGSTFWFTFVADQTSISDDYQKQSLPEKQPDPAKLNVLLVEDKKVNQKVFTIMLNSLGYDVTLAENGQHALETYSPGKFDLILMDIQMPVMDGITATQKLKTKYSDMPPIIGLSANAFEGDREKYMQLGMDEYLTKPLKKEDLFDVLKRFSFNKTKDQG